MSRRPAVALALLLIATRTAAADPPAVRVALVGDSTVADQQGWGPAFGTLFGPGVAVTNFAKNGATLKSFRAAGLWKKALDSKPEWVLIQFGHNDMKGKAPDAAAAYRDDLARFVDEARAAGAKPVVVTSLTRRLFGADGKVHSNLGEYVGLAKGVAADRKTPLIDLHARSVEQLDALGPKDAAAYDPPGKDGEPDRTHLSPKGAAATAALVAGELKTAVPELAKHLK